MLAISSNINQMKLIFPFLFVFSFGYSQTNENLEEIRAILIENFPGNTWFVYEDYDAGIEEDALSFRFHNPEVEMKDDTLRLTYVKETKGWENELSVEKIERIAPMKCIVENYTFQIHFGQNDWFAPGLHYRYFDVADNCAGLEVNVYKLNPNDWEEQMLNEEPNDIERNNIWFPSSKSAGKKLDRLFQKVLRKNKKQ